MNSFIKANAMRCIGCRTCQIGCVVAHEGMDIFSLNPEDYDFHPKLFLVKTVEVTAPVQCHHCEKPLCMAACLEGAIYQDGDRVSVNKAKCSGCKACLVACPFGAVELVGSNEKQEDGENRKTLNKCDLCQGRKEGPACVEVCPMDALELVTEDWIEKSLQKKRWDTVGS